MGARLSHGAHPRPIEETTSMSLIVDVHMQAGLAGEHLDPFAHSQLRKTMERRSFNFDGSDPASGKGDVDFVKRMDEAGVDVICLMSGDYNRVLPGSIESYEAPNDYLAGVVARHPTRIVGTCSVDPITDTPAAVREIERSVHRHGFRAVKLYPTFQHWDPRDERLYPVYRKCIDLDVLVQMHMGWTPVLSAPMEFQRPWLLDEVGRTFPELKLVINHLAYPYVDECTCLIARHENFYCDISLWAFLHPSKILRMLVDFGSICSFDKMLYGSENPFFQTYPKVLRSLNSFADRYGLPRIPDGAMRKIMGENACRLWQIDPARMGRAAQKA
jgi:predicted TIM-barrel fold metal-dependent hydrolase